MEVLDPSTSSLVTSRQLVLEPKPDTSWASEMVLNPALLRDPVSNRLHMLFRATGPSGKRANPGQPLPYPIHLGYAYSDDDGATWQADYSRPALTPALAGSPDNMWVQDFLGREVVNYANGCVEDPRLFWLEGVCYLIVACRMFPPGPYWIKDDPLQCAPHWAATSGHPFGRAASENVTVNVLYQVDLDRLARDRYGSAFRYVTHLTNPAYGENRDVLLFPEKLSIYGKDRYVCLHRPWEAQHYPHGSASLPPSIWMCVSDHLETLWMETTTHALLASPRFTWERNRIGASAPPLKIGAGQWLLSYHGKQDPVIGYTQSFMILQEDGEGLPRIAHRCPDRLFVPEQTWERPGKFTTPCLFITGLIEHGEDELMVSYGAADEKVGIAIMRRQPLIDHIKRYGPDGRL